MRVVIQQADMDTCLTGLILGVSPADQIEVVRGAASTKDLADPAVLCIEAGGSGQIHLSNFDHHDTPLPLPPACRQALEATGRTDPRLCRLVNYVAAIDAGGPKALGPAPGFPTLSGVFSGMRLVLKESPRDQFREGLAIFRTVLDKGFDPFGLMPERSEWREYLEAKRREDEALAQAKADAEIFVSRSGKKVGFLQTDFIGALGALYELGCAIAIAYSLRYIPPSGGDPVPKYTIGGNNGVRVDHLLRFLNAREPGWGGPGHGTIIASPREGSKLDQEEVKELVREYT